MKTESLPPRACKSIFPQALSFLRSQQFYQAQDHLSSALSWESSICMCWALLPVPPWRAVSARQWQLVHVQAVNRLQPWAQHYHSPTIWQLHCTGEHLRCAATARGKYFQKDLISFSRCLQNCFLYILTQVPLKAKLSLPQENSLWGQLLAPVSVAMGTLHKTIWLSRSVSRIREPPVWGEREGRKPASLPPGELNSL